MGLSRTGLAFEDFWVLQHESTSYDPHFCFLFVPFCTLNHGQVAHPSNVMSTLLLSSAASPSTVLKTPRLYRAHGQSATTSPGERGTRRIRQEAAI